MSRRGFLVRCLLNEQFNEPNMKPAPSSSTDEERIRQLLEQWANATKMNRRDDILANHASDAVIFDVLPPLKYEGIAAYRKNWDDWQPETVGANLFDLHELQITVGRDVGFAHAFIHCIGPRDDSA